MPNQKGVVAPLLIFAVVAMLVVGAALYYLGVFNSPESSNDAYQPVITPSLSQESNVSSEFQAPSPSAYSNPFFSDDSYENPFNEI